MVKSAKSKKLGYTGDAEMNRWPLSLQKVADRFPDAQMVIPGHGAPGGLELISLTLNKFDSVK